MSAASRGVEPRAGRSHGAPALAPTVPVDGHIAAELDNVLSVLGCRAAAGDSDATNALYAAYAPRLGYWVRRAQRALEHAGVERALEPEDIAQQAYVVFAEMLRAWDDDRDLSRYVLAYFPWRLSDAVRRMRDQRPRSPLQTAPAPLLADDSWVAAEAIALLEAIAGDLPEREGRVLLLRVRDGLSWREIARVSGIDRRTMFRIWKRLLVQLRGSLGSTD